MITSARRYEITRTRATEVRNALAELQRSPVADMLQPEMRELQLAALRGTSMTSKSSRPTTTAPPARQDLSVADVLIPDVPDDAIAAIDIKAQRLGISQADYLRRVLARERAAQAIQVSGEDLASFAETLADLDDTEVMSRAWR